jgi:hypothetical protein
MQVRTRRPAAASEYYEGWRGVTIDAHPGWPAPKDKGDVDTVEHLVSALYDVISGPAGKARDWDRFRALFLRGSMVGETLIHRWTISSEKTAVGGEH